MNDDQHIHDQLTTIISECDREVENIAAASQQRYLDAMKPGERKPSFRTYTVADAQGEAERRAACLRAYHKMADVIDRDVAAHDREVSAPADANDAATVQLACSREHVSEAELRALMGRYGGNHTLASVIRDRAAKERVFFDALPTFDGDEAKRRALRITDSYDKSLATGLLADSIMEGYRHIDLLGRSW